MNIQLDTYIPLWTFIALMVMTPGPANLLFMSSGLHGGLRATMPFLAGNITGMLILNVGMAIGIGGLLRTHSEIEGLLTLISVSYMIYLTINGWNSQADLGSSEKSALSFTKGVFVQPLSPKSWLMTTLAYSQFATGFNSNLEVYLIVPLSFAVFQLIFHSSWCFAGSLLQQTIGENLILNRVLIILTISVVFWAVFL